MGIFRKKNMSARASRKRSDELRSAQLGSHVNASNAFSPSKRRKARHAPHGYTPLEDMEFGSARKARRATRGHIDVIAPETSTTESHQAARKRRNQLDYAQTELRSDRRRSRLVLVGVILLAILVGAGVGIAVYSFNVNSRMNLGEDVSGVLVKQTSGEPYYVLLAADLQAFDGEESLDAMLLVRINEETQEASVLSVPATIALTMSDGKTYPANQVYEIGGYSQLISALSTYMDLSISHFIVTDSQGISAITDAVGGVEMTLSSEVDDPRAGTAYLKAGNQTVTGKSVTTLLLAKNYTDGIVTRADNQCAFAVALSQKILALDTAGLSTLFDAAAGHLKSDWTVADMTSVADKMRSMNAATISTGHVTGYEQTRGGTTTFTPSSEWTSVLQKFKSGTSPSIDTSVDTSGVDPSEVTVYVRNGVGIAGGAAKLADILTQAGFNVKDTGNADEFVYNETLIVYNSESDKAAAYKAQQALGGGRVVASNGYYALETNLLVILGSDWKL